MAAERAVEERRLVDDVGAGGHRVDRLLGGFIARPLVVDDALADAELLIADGHHRYETARVYAEEIGGEGDHRYVLMCLVALEDEGLTVFPTHRLVQGRRGPRRRRPSPTRCAGTSSSSRRRSRSWRPPESDGRSSWATSTPTSSSRSASR